jgi:hypothetical protein
MIQELKIFKRKIMREKIGLEPVADDGPRPAPWAD